MLLCITHCSDYGVLVGRHRDITRTCTPQYEEIKINPSPESGFHCKRFHQFSMTVKLIGMCIDDILALFAPDLYRLEA